MGLDIIMYDAAHTTIDSYEIVPSLHRAIFQDSPYWRSYPYLRRLKDYYRTNVIFDHAEIAQLIHDIQQIRPFVAPSYHPMIDSLLRFLHHDGSVHIHIGGD